MSTPALFFCAHQDDEVLQFSVDILRHIAAGRPTYAILYSTGVGSSAHGMINGTAPSGWWGGTHSPAVEGYQPLTDETFAAARTREFRSSLGQLGVPAANIILDPLDNVDVTKANMIAYFRRYAAQFGVASFKTHSYYDLSSHHAIGGEALRDLVLSGEISDGRFYLSRANMMAGGTTGKLTSVATSAEMTKISRAIKCYYAWNPAAESYAVGAHSVPTQWTHFQGSPALRYHTASD